MDSQTVFLIHLTATLFMFGLIWFVQIVHYPLYDGVDPACFAKYEQRHTVLVSWLVVPGMGVEGFSALYLLLLPPAQVPIWLWWLGLALVGVNAVSTAFLQVPQHNLLVNGYDDRAHRKLVRTNWIRTVVWTLRTALLLWALKLMMTC